MILFKVVKKLKLPFIPKKKKDRHKVKNTLTYLSKTSLLIIHNNNSKNFSKSLERSTQPYYLTSQVKHLWTIKITTQPNKLLMRLILNWKLKILYYLFHHIFIVKKVIWILRALAPTQLFRIRRKCSSQIFMFVLFLWKLKRKKSRMNSKKLAQLILLNSKILSRR